MQARLVVRLHDSADLELHRVLARIDGEHRHPNDDRGEDGDDQQQIHAWTHRGFSVSAFPARASAARVLVVVGGATARRRRRLGGRRGRAALHELVERQVQHVVAAFGVDEDLRRVPQDLFERLDVHALARDARRFLVLDEDLREAVGLALRVGDDLLSIGLCVLAAPLAPRRAPSAGSRSNRSAPRESSARGPRAP